MREIENYDNFEKNRSSKIPDIIEKYNLTPRQCEILSLRFSGVTKKADVAQRLGIGVSTLYREMQSKPLQLAIGELSIQLLEQNQTDARNLTQVALDYLLSVIDSPDIPVDIKLKATKQAVEATTALDRAKIEDEVMRVWRSNAVPQVSNMLESSGDFDLLE